ADRAVRIAILDAEVAPEQAGGGEIAGTLGVRRRAGLQDQALAEVRRSGELEDETRLANSGLAHQRHHLPLSARRHTKPRVQRRQLVLAAHEPRCRTPERQSVALASS